MSGYSKRKKRGGKIYDFWTDRDGVRLKDHHLKAIRSTLPVGCGTSVLAAEDLNAMRELCDHILDKLPSQGLVPWGDGWTDQKTRGYAMLPEHSDFKSVTALTDSGIVMHDADALLSPDEKVRNDGLRKHEHTVSKSFVTVNPPPHQMTAIEHLIQQVNEILHTPENLPHLQPYERDAVCIANLVAIQPNFHNGDDYLPLHLDNPRHDGFGVVIVTVAVWGSADIVLVDDGDPEPSTANITHPTNNANTTENQEEQDEEVQSESTVDLSIARHTITALEPELSLPPLQPVVCEGGIVYRNGEFIVKEEAVPSETVVHSSTTATATTGTGTIRTPHATNTAIDNTHAFPTNTHNSATTSSSTNTSRQPDSMAPNASTSTSWAFPLSPGQLYVLSGPARNKCAHGVVVDTSNAPIGKSKRQRGRAVRGSADGSGGSDNNSLTTETSGGSGGSTAVPAALPNLTLLAKLSASSSTADTAHTATDTATITTTNITTATIPPTPTTTTTSTIATEQPQRYTGRVSLNFRFGLHTIEQAFNDIDRHWG